MKRDYGLIALGAGITAIGIGIVAWSSYDYLTKRRLIEDYITEAKIYREALIRAYEDGIITDDEQRFLEFMMSELTRKEKLIEQAGAGEQLVEALKWTFGIVIAYAAYKVTSRLIQYFNRRYRPPDKKWVCDVCGAEFSTEDELNTHVGEHRPAEDVSKFVDLWSALQQVPEWLKYIIADIAGLTVAVINQPVEWFEGLPDDEKRAIGAAVAIAIIIVSALIWWLRVIPVIANLIRTAASVLL